MKIFLCAYNKIGCDIFDYLVANYNKEDIAVFTHEVKNSFIPSVVEKAENCGVWYTTKSINKAELPFKPDIISSVYYRYIIKEHIIKLVNNKLFNVHPSLLPRHRGCSSIPWAIIEGDDITGVSFHYMDEGVDTGKIILQATTQIDYNETAESLYNKCMNLGADFFPAAFELVKSGFLGIKQRGKSCYHNRGAPYDGIIRDNWDKNMVERFIRAMTHPPYPYAKYKGEEVKNLEKYSELKGMKWLKH